jgi:hypothetical protein
MLKEKEPRKLIQDLHFEHKIWKNQFEFCKDEMQFFNARLEEVADKNTSKEVMIEVGRFQNQFIIQRDEIDRFLHDIHVHDDALVQEVKDNPVAVDHRHMKDHPEERDRFETFIKLYTEMKKSFMEFLRKRM